MEELFCIGCGAQIQTEDKEKAGFTPASSIKKAEETGEIYCQRCFRLRHYNEIVDVHITDDEFLKLLQLLPKDSDENIIKDFKERFKKEYDETSEALEWHIETLVNFGGDSTHKIYKAMIEVINDIINDAPSTDKDGMIEYLQEMI